MVTINFWPILVASIVAFALGALWYSSILFGDEWMSLMKITDKDVAAAKAKGGMWKLYVVQIVFTIVSYCVLGFLVTNMASVSASDGAFLGFLVWLGFTVPAAVERLIWEKKPLKLILIQGVLALLNLVIGGAVIGAWR